MDHDATTKREATARQLCLVWAGLVIGVSFLATPVKFLAPSLELLPALDVGRQTFFALNRLELVLGLGLAVIGGWPSRQSPWRRLIWLAPCLVVALQAALLLPVLDARVEVILSGGRPAPSRMHEIYIAVELLKLVVLLGLGLIRRAVLVSACEPSQRPRSLSAEGHARSTS